MARADVKAADEIERFREVVQVEREAILELIESEGANAHLYDGDYHCELAHFVRCVYVLTRGSDVTESHHEADEKYKNGEKYMVGLITHAARTFDRSSSNHNRCCKNHLRAIRYCEGRKCGKYRDLAERLLPRQAEQYYYRC